MHLHTVSCHSSRTGDLCQYVAGHVQFFLIAGANRTAVNLDLTHVCCQEAGTIINHITICSQSLLIIDYDYYIPFVTIINHQPLLYNH